MRNEIHAGHSVWPPIFLQTRLRCKLRLVSILIPLLVGGCQHELRREQKSTGTSLGSIGAAISAYASDGHVLPVLTDVPAKRLETALVPRYLKEVAEYDEWGNPLRVTTSPTSYVIWSTGTDGRKDERWIGGGTHDPSRDLVYANGRFVQYPIEGASVVFNPSAWDSEWPPQPRMTR
jgi:hypothetical protein